MEGTNEAVVSLDHLPTAFVPEQSREIFLQERLTVLVTVLIDEVLAISKDRQYLLVHSALAIPLPSLSLQEEASEALWGHLPLPGRLRLGLGIRK